MNDKGKNQITQNKTALPSSPDSFPALMIESELIQYLRIPEVSAAKDYHNVIKNLIRFRDLPRIQICKKLLFPTKAVLDWIEKETIRK